MGSGNWKASAEFPGSPVKYTQRQIIDFGTIIQMGESFTVIKYTILLHFSIFSTAFSYNNFIFGFDDPE